MKKIILSLILIAVCSGVYAEKTDVIKSKKDDLPPILGGVVRSVKWFHKKNLPFEDSEEFIGDVSYKNPYYEVKADWALSDRLKNTFFARKNVWGKKIWKDGSVSEVSGDSAQYNRNTQTAQMLPQEGGFVKIKHSEPAHGIWRSLSRKVTFDEKEQQIDLMGDVQIKSEQNNALADKISYYYQSNSFEFSGDPAIWGTYKDYNFAVTGKHAKADNFFNKIEVKEKVTGWIKNTKGTIDDAIKMSKP